MKSHLFIIYIDRDGSEFLYQGGFDKLSLNPLPGVRTPYEPGVIDWDTKAPSVTVLEGRGVTDKIACLDAVSRRIVADKINYDFLGPNSNSVVFTLLEDCGIKIGRPDDLGTVVGYPGPFPGYELKFPDAWQ